MSDYDEYEYEDDDWLYIEEHFDLAPSLNLTPPIPTCKRQFANTKPKQLRSRLFNQAAKDKLTDPLPQQDELVEGPIPSPYDPPLHLTTDFDTYQYFNDLEYLSDAYYDNEKPPRPSKSSPSTAAPTKRKRGSRAVAKPDAAGPKKQKKDAEGADDPVLWVSNSDRRDMSKVKDAPVVGMDEVDGRDSARGKGSKSEGASEVALLKDWRTRFSDAPGLAAKRKRAADTANTAPHSDAAEQGPPVQQQIAVEAAEDSLRPAKRSRTAAPDPAAEAERGAEIDPQDLQSVLAAIPPEYLQQLQEVVRREGGDDTAIGAVPDILRDLMEGKVYEDEEGGGGDGGSQSGEEGDNGEGKGEGDDDEWIDEDEAEGKGKKKNVNGVGKRKLKDDAEEAKEDNRAASVKEGEALAARPRKKRKA